MENYKVLICPQVFYRIDHGRSEILYTFDKQSENNDELGMAINLPSAAFDSFFRAPDENPDIQHTYGVLITIKDKPAIFRFYAGRKNRSGDGNRKWL